MLIGLLAVVVEPVVMAVAIGVKLIAGTNPQRFYSRDLLMHNIFFPNYWGWEATASLPSPNGIPWLIVAVLALVAVIIIVAVIVVVGIEALVL